MPLHSSAQERTRLADDALLGLDVDGTPCVNLESLRGRRREKLADWRGLLTRNVEEGRAVLRALLIGPITFTPVVEERRRGYRFHARIALDRLLDGVVVLPPKGTSPSGTTTFSTPDPSRLKGRAVRRLA